MTYKIKFLYCIVGSLIFSISVNLFLIPIGIYSGGFLGIAQLLRDLVNHVVATAIPFDIAGLINFLLNAILLIIAIQVLSKEIVINTLVVIAAQTFFLSIIPIPKFPIVNDVFMSVLIGTVLCAYGTSFFFKGKGSGGGSDIIGLWMTKRGKGSVGTVYTIVNMIIYFICFVLYNYEIALYSIVHSLILSFILDRIHEDNVESAVLIITEDIELKERLFDFFKRGITSWTGKGFYTGNSKEVLFICMTKNQVVELKRYLKSGDDQSFMITFDRINVLGWFPKMI